MAKHYRHIAIVHHTYTITSLVEEELRNYLLSRTDLLTYISLPFKQARDAVTKNVKVKMYRNGLLYKQRKGPSAAGHEAFFFVRDIVVTTLYFFAQPKIDIFFGVDNLNAFSGILLRKMGRTSKVIYYVIDYVPDRFSNPFLNRLYHWVDLFCVKHSDQTWNLSHRMADIRQKNGLDPIYRSRQITVPIGCHPVSTPKRTISPPSKLVFLGILNHEQGVENLIHAFVEIQKKIHDVTLTIIGSGDLFSTLKKEVSKLQLDRYVKFLGFVESNKKVDQILSTCDVGVAPYIIEPNSFKQFTDPGKIKAYLGAGLPVVMSDISDIASIIKRQQAGLITNGTSKDLANKLITLLENQEKYYEIQKNAKKLGQKYSWDSIFTSSFEKFDSR